MRPSILRTVFCLFMLGTPFWMASGGCASTAPATQTTAVQQLALLESSYTIALHTLRNARDNGVLTPAEVEQTRPMRDAVGAALDRADALRSQPGDPAELQSAVSAATAALLQFQSSSALARAIQHQRASTRPTTAPSP